jgi:hypothetical protein
MELQVGCACRDKAPPNLGRPVNFVRKGNGQEEREVSSIPQEKADQVGFLILCLNTRV